MNALPVILATKFPADFVGDTIVPGLRDLGIHVERVVSTRFEGAITADVLFMLEYCGHDDQSQLKARTKAAGFRFVLLSRKRADWAGDFRKVGYHVPGHPVNPTPLPVAETPKKPAGIIVANGAPLLPPPPMVPVEALPFGKELRDELKRQGITQKDFAALVGVSAPTVVFWIAGKPAQPDHYAKILDLLPALKDKAKPPLPLRDHATGRTKAPVALPSVTSPQPVAVALPEPLVAPAPVAPPQAPVAVFSPRVASAARPPLAGLLRAARALGIKGPVTVVADDPETVVTVGGEPWKHTDADVAVEAARKALVARLADVIRCAQEATAELEGAA